MKRGVGSTSFSTTGLLMSGCISSWHLSMRVANDETLPWSRRSGAFSTRVAQWSSRLVPRCLVLICYFQRPMILRDVVFDVYKARRAYDPMNGRPLNSLYRYSGPLGPAYLGWTEDDRMTWIEGPQVGAANLDWGPGAPVTSLDEREALREGVALRTPNRVMRASGPYGWRGGRLTFESEAGEWTLQGKQYKGFNRLVWRGAASSGEVMGLLSNRTGKRGFLERWPKTSNPMKRRFSSSAGPPYCKQ